MHKSNVPGLAALYNRADFLWNTLKASKDRGEECREDYSKELEDIFFKIRELRGGINVF